jgi:hypothetical protein
VGELGEWQFDILGGSMSTAEQRRIQTIAEQAITLGVAPAATALWRKDPAFGRQHSAQIWDAVSAIRSGKSKPADHRIPGIGGPDDKDHTIPPGRVKDPPDADDDADEVGDAEDEETEPCDRCGGSGMVDGDVCDKCGGTGRVPSDDDQDQDDDRDDDQHADDSDDSDFD